MFYCHLYSYSHLNLTVHFSYHYLPYWSAAATLASPMFIEHSELPSPAGLHTFCFLCPEHAQSNLLPFLRFLYGLCPYSLHNYRNKSSYWAFSGPILFKMDSLTPGFFVLKSLLLYFSLKHFYHILTCCIIYIFTYFVCLSILECKLNEGRHFVFLTACPQQQNSNQDLNGFNCVPPPPPPPTQFISWSPHPWYFQLWPLERGSFQM